MAKVYDLRTRKRKAVTQLEFTELLEALEKYIERLRPLRKNQKGLNNALDIIELMKFNGMFSPKIRDEHIQELEELLDNIHIELETKK